MTLKSPKRAIVLALITLLLASLACNLPGGARPPQNVTPIPITTESVEELERNLQEAAQQATETGQVRMVITEAQLTSMVAFELEEVQEPRITEPQVFLRDGQMQLYGNVQQSGITAPLKVFMTISADEQGKPRYEITDATAGPFPLPQSMLNQMTTRLDQVISEQMSSGQTSLFIDDITIANGEMIIEGHRI